MEKDSFHSEVDISQTDEGINEVEDDGKDYVPFEIPKEVAPVNEVHEFSRLLTCNGKSESSLYVNALFDVLSARSCNTITEESGHERLFQLYDQVATEFILGVENYPKKEYCRENVLEYLPGKNYQTFCSRISKPCNQ